jgi:hypothetical protein
MIDLMPDILQALGTDPTLLSLCGGNKVYQYTIPQDSIVPYIRIADLNNLDDNFADNDAISSELLYQVDVWDNSGQLIGNVDQIMKSLGFARYYLTGDWDKDVLAVRKTARYRITKSF